MVWGLIVSSIDSSEGFSIVNVVKLLSPGNSWPPNQLVWKIFLSGNWNCLIPKTPESTLYTEESKMSLMFEYVASL